MDLKSFFSDLAPGVRRYGVVGSGIGYTLSPAMHNAALERYALKAVYRKIDIPENEWESFRSQIDDLNGFNITKPFKEKARAIGSVWGGAEGDFIGAVNTAHRDVRWRVANTDVEGFRTDAESQGIEWGGRRVVLLGAGGAARAALGALLKSPPSSVVLYNRHPDRARHLVGGFPPGGEIVHALGMRVAAAESDPGLQNAEVVINATPAGQRPGDSPPMPLAFLRAGMVVYDMVYNRETELVKAAREKGGRAVGGLGMLVNQGALAFELWFGEELKKLKYDPLELRRLMRGAAENALKEKP